MLRPFRYMPSFHYDYRIDPQRPSRYLKPLISVSFLSNLDRRWFNLRYVLADTGADYTTLPLGVGERLVADIEQGQPVWISGVNVTANAFLHPLHARLGAVEFEVDVAIVTSNDVPPILGRIDALDRFAVTFHFGEHVIIETEGDE